MSEKFQKKHLKLVIFVVFASVALTLLFLSFTETKACPNNFANTHEPILAKNLLNGNIQVFLDPCTIPTGWTVVDNK